MASSYLSEVRLTTLVPLSVISYTFPGDVKEHKPRLLQELAETKPEVCLMKIKSLALLQRPGLIRFRSNIISSKTDGGKRMSLKMISPEEEDTETLSSIFYLL